MGEGNEYTGLVGAATAKNPMQCLLVDSAAIFKNRNIHQCTFNCHHFFPQTLSNSYPYIQAGPRVFDEGEVSSSVVHYHIHRRSII